MNGKLSSADYMEVKMEYGLTCIGSAVCDDTVTVGAAAELSDFGNLFENLSYYSAVFGIDLINRCDVLLGNYENVTGSFGIDILEGIHIVVFVYFCGGNVSCYDFTENAVHR